MENNEFQFEWEGAEEDRIFFRSFEHVLFDDNDFMNLPPSMYQVLLLNDSETPVDFVMFVLQRVFHYSQVQASELVAKIHRSEMAVCGTFTRDAAETKILLVSEYASRNSHPLKCVMQKELEHAIKES